MVVGRVSLQARIAMLYLSICVFGDGKEEVDKNEEESHVESLDARFEDSIDLTSKELSV